MAQPDVLAPIVVVAPSIQDSNRAPEQDPLYVYHLVDSPAPPPGSSIVKTQSIQIPREKPFTTPVPACTHGFSTTYTPRPRRPKSMGHSPDCRCISCYMKWEEEQENQEDQRHPHRNALQVSGGATSDSGASDYEKNTGQEGRVSRKQQHLLSVKRPAENSISPSPSPVLIFTVSPIQSASPSPCSSPAGSRIVHRAPDSQPDRMDIDPGRRRMGESTDGEADLEEEELMRPPERLGLGMVRSPASNNISVMQTTEGHYCIMDKELSDKIREQKVFEEFMHSASSDDCGDAKSNRSENIGQNGYAEEDPEEREFSLAELASRLKSYGYTTIPFKCQSDTSDADQDYDPEQKFAEDYSLYHARDSYTASPPRPGYMTPYVPMPATLPEKRDDCSRSNSGSLAIPPLYTMKRTGSPDLPEPTLTTRRNNSETFRQMQNCLDTARDKHRDLTHASSPRPHRDRLHGSAIVDRRLFLVLTECMNSMPSPRKSRVRKSPSMADLSNHTKDPRRDPFLKPSPLGLTVVTAE